MTQARSGEDLAGVRSEWVPKATFEKDDSKDELCSDVGEETLENSAKAVASGLLTGIIERISKFHWKMEADDMLDAMLMSTPVLTGISGR
ncbi:hypothetical protein LTR12_012979 [Friedmanniomyces endolithicus]|nr:hypothetical protein LTR12_012979 [Friedmanniomyces endolithicus]